MAEDNSDIAIDYNNSAELYDEDTVNTVIERFIDSEFEELKDNIKATYDSKNYKELKRLVHTFKTTVRYMGSEGFAHLCEGIEKCVKTGEEDPVLLVEKFPFFMKKYAALYALAKIEYNRIKGIVEPETKTSLFTLKSCSNNQQENTSSTTQDKHSDRSKNFKNSPVSMNGGNNSIIIGAPSIAPSAISTEKSQRILIRLLDSNEKYGDKLFLLSAKMILKNECDVSIDDIDTAFDKSDFRELKRIIITLKVLSIYLCSDEFISICEKNEKLLNSDPASFLANKELFLFQYDIFFNALIEYSDKVDEYAQTLQPAKKKKRIMLQRCSTIANIPSLHSRESLKKISAFTELVNKVNNPTSELEKIDENNQTFTNLANKAKNNFFAIDRGLIKIKGGIIEGKKERYDYQKMIMSLSQLFELALENKSQVILLQALNLLKEITMDYNFEALQACLTEWSNEIRSKANLSFFQIEYEDIDVILRSMVKEIKDILTQDIEKTQNVVNSRKYIDSPQSGGGVIIKTDDKMLDELKCIETSEFFRVTVSKEDIDKEIEILNQLGSQNQKMLAKKILSKQKTINPLLDCNYPFKEEAFSCLII